MKVCTICSEAKDFSEYHRGKVACKACRSEQNKRYYVENKAMRNSQMQKNYQANKEVYHARSKKWAQANPEKVAAFSDKWRRKNLDVDAANSALKRANKKTATPAWADKEEIKHIYKLAREHGMAVDHLVPLNSDFVCGLHTADNLRCIHPLANSIKGNRHWPDMWGAQYGQ